MSIIVKNNYFKYIDDSNDLTECQKKMLKSYYNDLNKIYVDKTSNKQIQTLIIDCYKQNDINKIAKISNMLQSFFKKEIVLKLIYDIKKHKLNDADFVDQIIKYKNDKNGGSIMKKHICNNWIYIIQYIIMNYKKITNYKNTDINYLDIGCGNGSKTLNFANELNLNQKNIYGADINTWGPYNQNTYEHKFNFIEITDGKINLPDNSVDFASCILMLHHVEKIENIIIEIARVLKPDAILVIIEHNNYDDYDKMLLDIVHLIYGYLYDKNTKYLSNPDYAQYYNFYEWKYIFENNGFQNIKYEQLFLGLSNEIRYDNLFYSFFINKKKTTRRLMKRTKISKKSKVSKSTKKSKSAK